ncbi:MAG TPA: copper chaperone CopZ [Anaerovoracaceae bacterium]|nr:copper chaperone CopZ [Anaerovoracaceae bacterium]
MTKSVLNVEGMSCSHCVSAVTKAVTALEGVSGVNVDLEGKTATVDYDAAKVSLESIKEAIEDEGYDVV